MLHLFSKALAEKINIGMVAALASRCSISEGGGITTGVLITDDCHRTGR
jgi:hypothetical protein